MPSQDASVSCCAVGCFILFSEPLHRGSLLKREGKCMHKNWVHSQAAFIKRFLFGSCDSKVRSQEPLLCSILPVLFLPAVWAIVVKYILAVVSQRVLCPDVMLLHFGP